MIILNASFGNFLGVFRYVRHADAHVGIKHTVAFFGSVWFIKLRTRKELYPGFMFLSRLLS